MSARHSIGQTFALVLAGTLLGAAAGVTTAATPAADGPAIAVKYKDLDLNTREGSVTLYKRIADAASEVCSFADNRDLAAVAQSRACRRAAIDRAVNDLHSPQLAAVHLDHMRKG
jgi:UrcA family protein